MHPQNPRRPRRDRLPRMLAAAVLLRNDDLDGEIMRYSQPRRGLDITERVRAEFDRRWELALDKPAPFHIEVCFPSLFDLTAADFADIFVQDAFSLSAELRRVFLAGFGDELEGLVDTPVHASDAPAGGDAVLGLGDDAGNAHADGKVAERVDDGGKSDVCNEVGGGKDAGGGLVLVGHKGALDGQGAGDGDVFGEVGYGFGGEDVVDAAKGAVACDWYVAGKEV